MHLHAIDVAIVVAYLLASVLVGYWVSHRASRDMKAAPNPAYVEVAADNLHYLLGRNAFSVSWVSQVGGNPFRHPHHRPSQADKLPAPWPGLVSGGPNADQGDFLQRLPANTPPAKVWEDNWKLAAANEVAINWQGVLVFLLAGQLQRN